MLTSTREYKSHSFNLETDIALFSVVTFRTSHPLAACLRHDFSTFLTSTFRIFQRPERMNVIKRLVQDRIDLGYKFQ